MTRSDFFLELRTEEIPAAVIASARSELTRRLEEALAAEGLPSERSESWATPRRLAVALRGIPDVQEDKDSEILGPPASAAFDAQGRPTRAAEGFARAQKADVADLVVVESPRGPTAAVRKRIPGRRAAEVLSEVVPRVVRDMTFPKMMRWGEGRRSFVRPLRSVVALLGGEVVGMEILGVAAGDTTVGHRILSEATLTVRGPEDWLEKLRAAGVEPDGERRRMQLLEQARSLAASVNGSIESDSDLTSTLADLVEWPGVVRGSFSGEFLELPEEITITAMRTHQKYLPIRGPGGLLPHFVAVMDNKQDTRGFVAKGNEWVLNARLADARFFYREDTKRQLESRRDELARLVVQDRLGEVRAKTERLEELAESIAHIVGRPDLVDTVRGAARLSKLDLPTLMVKEFPDLQGIVGGIYARREGYPDSVWKAVYDQYRPVTAGDDPPREAAGSVLGLADRFDTLAGFFSIGLAPTGSKDPYGLRRCASGLVAIVLSRNWRLDWRPIARKAVGLYPAGVSARPAEETLEELSRFFADRVRGLLERRSHTHDEISAVLRTGVWDFADAADRAAALADARRHMDFRSLILAFKRIRNIVGDGAPRSGPSPELYKEDAERALAADFLQARRAIEGLYGTRRYREAMEMIASLAPSLDRFFVEVLVNCPEEELRNNRLALLAAIQKEFSRLADFSEIVVEK